MIGPVARDETADMSTIKSEFISDLHPRPDFNLLPLLGRQSHFFADRLFFVLCMSQIEPATGRKIAIDVLLPDDLRHAVPIPESHSEDNRCLSLTFGPQDLDWK